MTAKAEFTEADARRLARVVKSQGVDARIILKSGVQIVISREGSQPNTLDERPEIVF
jgi:hypothetical protein